MFSDLSRRGLRGVRYVVSDDHQGMRRAIDRHFQGVLWQRCQVHFVRNILNHTARREKAFVLGLLKAITEAPTLVAARQRWPKQSRCSADGGRKRRLCWRPAGKRS